MCSVVVNVMFAGSVTAVSLLAAGVNGVLMQHLDS